MAPLLVTTSNRGERDNADLFNMVHTVLLAALILQTTSKKFSALSTLILWRY